ncbi:hypothetical protein ABFS83_14G185000 [Erythranthe nasuta]
MMFFKNPVFGSCLMLLVFMCWFNAKSGDAFGTFGFDIHHRYSDTVKEFLDLDGLPEKGTVDYYTAMAHRDQLFMKGRRLAAGSTPVLTFFGSGTGANGNKTYSVSALSYLHYALIKVGTPALSFLVALDTGSDLFWLPCDCLTCARNFNITDGKRFELSIYSPSNSTTSSPLPCNSTLCGPTRGCLARSNTCAYQEVYSTSSSSGILVDDVLHLGTDTNPQDPIDVSVTFGCGKNQTGRFLESGGGINGIFGLGMDSISVPSILASKSVTANSFSMCFAAEGSSGRIEFGDKGSPLQKTTPFNLQKSNPTYNVTVTKIAVGNNVTDLQFAANFNSGTAITRLTDPAYSFITNNFNSRITEKPYHYSFDFVLHYCYALSANQDSYTTPNLTFTMKGGSQFNVTVPTIQFEEDDGSVFCLALIKSEGINVIGQNFMTGYRLVFDREEMVLGWKESDCYDSISSSAQPPPKGNSTRSRAAQQSPPPPPPPPPSGVARLSSVTSGLMVVMLVILFHNFIALSS